MIRTSIIAEHQSSRAVVDYVPEQPAGTLAVGDVRDVADGERLNRQYQQQISTWTHGRLRQAIRCQAEVQGMAVVRVDEASSSQTGPNPAWRQRHKPQGRVYRCPACGVVAHRDLVGPTNLLSRQRQRAVGQIRPLPRLTHRRLAAATGVSRFEDSREHIA